MSVTQKDLTSNHLHIDVDLGKIFVFDNRFQKGTLKNTTGGTLEFKAGTLLGRESDSEDLVILRSGTSTKGENTPVGILAQTLTLDNAATAPVQMCTAGKVVEDKIIFEGADGFDTVVALKTLRDRIGSDTVGIVIEPSVSLTGFDNV